MITAICNQKGGVGKTVTTTALAHALAHTSHSVLVIDTDPQGNSTAILEATGTEFNLNDLLAAAASGTVNATRQAITPAGEAWPGIDVIPADRALASRETDVSIGREARLRACLAGVAGDYDHILIDCPPSLGMLTTNALTAADAAVIVTEAGETAADGVAEIVTTIAAVKTAYNPSLSLAGILINKFRHDRVERRDWRRKLSEYYGDLVLTRPLPEKEAVPRAAGAHTPIPETPDLQPLHQAIADVIATITKEHQ
ncbi:Cobyrinic acid ac-diamide synthase [Acidipropionibacterium acidipropionici ATCC 4875]|uniref:Cobyrinic acid ac-diamide synthase n=1 Tax=Acidipropionibacterium acidipropionici (strain ATCC 4875 / DSM 20272 / JCM 6432 / NBRC 12425 / NCIMB 8070 / 4) TaxID=1171373 RepID=K7RTE8_ACIA4|nr:ParA family protein [Acidipropionibacterium acidipropionici]AFV89676.1 Cobyrinic acid ac-diamide synthase [Acidipropionibacterium acidipropionici ATCC 4875]